MRWDRYFETLRSQPQCDRQLQQRGFICLLGSWCFKTISKIERVRLYKLRGFIALWICVEMRRAVFWVTMASCDAVLRRCVWFTLYWRWFSSCLFSKSTKRWSLYSTVSVYVWSIFKSRSALSGAWVVRFSRRLLFSWSQVHPFLQPLSIPFSIVTKVHLCRCGNFNLEVERCRARLLHVVSHELNFPLCIT